MVTISLQVTEQDGSISLVDVPPTPRAHVELMRSLAARGATARMIREKGWSDDHAVLSPLK